MARRKKLIAVATVVTVGLVLLISVGCYLLFSARWERFGNAQFVFQDSSGTDRTFTCWIRQPNVRVPMDMSVQYFIDTGTDRIPLVAAEMTGPAGVFVSPDDGQLFFGYASGGRVQGGVLWNARTSTYSRLRQLPPDLDSWRRYKWSESGSVHLSVPAPTAR